ncbi:fatty acyl-CoA reductase 1-like isoform X1 [Mangifera indica]|uniref:fatty acyl-CoA reductase 1-like isoform X1 n=1 Tax=Mangifera indica TaxID=29780 RepID=UPI001CF97FA0|nr:fatty acyl-CoA reductase 1-like isoform X1 [Mangifera indica]
MASISPLKFLKDKTILVTGATGFLAKVFVEKILRIQPNVKKLYLLVRARDSNFAMKRIFDEVVETELFRVVRDELGVNLKSFISEKIVAVAGDVSDTNLGVKDSKLMEEMWTEIDLVLNFAAITNFDERYDYAYKVNTMGAFNVLNFAKNCIKINMLVHVSTAYVCGERSGLILENPINIGEALKKTCKLEITEENKLIEEKLNQLQAKGAGQIELASTMTDLGIKRATFYGWPNTYVFTKAMGEMMLGEYRENMPLVIIRPTMITSTFAEPFPGWIEGLRTIDGAIAGYGKGKLKFLLANTKSIFDVIPADMVVNSIIMAMAANTQQNSQIIYHIGSSRTNPIKMTDIHKFSRQYFIEHPLINKYGKPVKVCKGRFFNTPASFHTWIRISYVMPLKVLKLISIFNKSYRGICIDHDKKIKFAIRLVELYKPYMFFRGIFDDTNSQNLRLTMEENAQEANAFNFNPKDIDWEDYFINTHIAGLVKYVLKQ